MIARLRGKAVSRRPDSLVLEVGGVGYLLQPTRRAAQKSRGKGEVVIETYLHVREDALQLYGFADADERELFEQLLSVSGVGPKVALAIVSGSTPGGAATGDRPRGHGPFPGHSGHRQEDGAARRARAEGETRHRR